LSYKRLGAMGNLVSLAQLPPILNDYI